ncbi:EAL domain-containing protein [Maritalea sp.]|uniref:EAL domain-containing protein n=1 Tax=Maritalea sp. TaxID=2003361 RepID=UPI0039E2DE50
MPKKIRLSVSQLLYEVAILLAGTFTSWWFFTYANIVDRLQGLLQSAQDTNVDELMLAGAFMIFLVMARLCQHCTTTAHNKITSQLVNDMHADSIAHAGSHVTDHPDVHAQSVCVEPSESDVHFGYQTDIDHIEHRLRSAIAREELTIHYQPYFCVRSNKLAGYEALARWPQRDGSFIPPSIFIEVAEKTGQIGELSTMLFKIACNEAKSWPSHLTLSFNISALQLHELDFASDIISLLQEFGLPPHRLELELTESTLVLEGKRAGTALRELRALGVSISLDDLGTGYSSFLRLAKTPIDKLKIDRHFVAECCGDYRVKKIVEAMVALGKSLDVVVVAEGVETEQQLHIISQMGCDIAQGFLLGSPRDAKHVNHDISYEASVVVPLVSRLQAS